MCGNTKENTMKSRQRAWLGVLALLGLLGAGVGWGLDLRGPSGIALVAQGGTGASTLTGVVIGSGTAPLTATALSAGIATALSDETGSGALVFGTGPTLGSPIIANIAPGANFTLTQNSVVPFTSEQTGAVVNTLYLKTGNVGIGTTNPARLLSLNGVTSAYLGLRVNDVEQSVIGAEATKDFLVYDTQTTTYRFVVLPTSGFVGVNQATPTFQFESVGTLRHASLTAAVATNSTLCIIAATKEVVENAAATCTVSSVRFKRDVADQGSALATLLALRPVSYRFKTSEEVRLGLIAEEVHAIEPRLVDLDGDGLPHSVRYDETVSVLVKGLQEQQAQIATLTARLARLEQGR
jgi:hypothetical protein